MTFYDCVSEELVLEHPGDSLQFVVYIGLLAEGIDEETQARLLGEISLSDDERKYARGGDRTMEFYPIRVSPESTKLILEALGLSEGDFPDAPIEA